MNEQIFEAIIRELLYLVDIQRKQIVGLNAMVQKGVKLEIPNQPNQKNEKASDCKATWPEDMNNDFGRQVFFDNLFTVMAAKNPNNEVDKERFLRTLKQSGIFTQSQAIQFLLNAESNGTIFEVAQNTLVRKNMEEGSITHE